MAEVQGTTPDGIAVTGKPVRIAGKDSGGLTQTIATDSDGNLQVAVASGTSAHDSAVPANGSQQMVEAADFDGSALPNAVAEGDAVRAKASLSGIQYVKLVSEDGSQSVEDEINNALNVQEIAPARDRFTTVEIQAAGTAVTAAETVIGGEINVTQYNIITIWVDYTKGDETSFDIVPKFLRVSGGDEHPFGSWSTGATRSFTASVFRLTATAKRYIVLNVQGINIIKVYGDATGGTPTGTCQVSISASNN